jgi:hypothetical protein
MRSLTLRSLVLASWMRHGDCGHTSCVQKTFLGKNHPGGGEPRKINIAANAGCARTCESKIAKKFVLERNCNLLKRKPVVMSGNPRLGAQYPWCSAYQRLGCWQQNIMRGIALRQSPKKLIHSLSGTTTNPPALPAHHWHAYVPRRPLKLALPCEAPRSFQQRSHRGTSSATPR